MPRKRKNRRNRRRQNFILLDAYEDGDIQIQQLVAEAKKHTAGQKKTKQLTEKAQHATKKAVGDAEAVTELFLPGVPETMTASSLVDTLLFALHTKGNVPADTVKGLSHDLGNAEKACILRCEIKPSKGRATTAIAFVTVRSRQLADKFIYCSPLVVQQRSIKILRGTRTSAPHMGSAWRAVSDPGSTRWKVGAVQVGERVSDDSFSSFWVSSPIFDITQNSHVELNPVAGVLALTFGRQTLMLKGLKPQSTSTALTDEPKDFTTTPGMLRIEIPFRSICDTPRGEVNKRTRDGHAILVSISKAPHLFRSSDNEAGASRSKTWDCLAGDHKEIRWIRTVDPTQNSAFSRARALRIFLSPEDITSFFRKLYHLCLVDSSRQKLIETKHFAEKTSPNRVAVFQTAAQVFKISFPLRYAVDSILSLSTLSVAGIDSQFWNVISTEMTEDEARSVLDCMLYRMSSNAAYRSINNPLNSLRDVMKLLNVRGKQHRNIQHAEDDSEDDSIGTEDTDEFVMERYVDELRLDQLTIEDDPDQPAVKRPSRQYAYIRRIICTPTRIIALKPEPDLLNRVLREFSEYNDRFLRVSFSDEDGGLIAFAASDDLYARVRVALRNGIVVAGEKFVFLAFSNSQLRDHSAWMYNETPDAASIPPTADDIRAWMGDFSMIRIPGKYVPRYLYMFFRQCRSV